MEYMNKSIEELHELLIKGKLTSKDLIKETLDKSHQVQDKYNAFVTILDDAKETSVTDNLLSGIPYGIKDNYSTKGILSTGSSNTLKDYVPFFTATAINNLTKAGAVPVNKTVLDEFEIIDESIDLINKIPNIEKIEPMTHCLDEFICELREDICEESIDINELLQNCDDKTDREISVPKVVG